MFFGRKVHKIQGQRVYSWALERAKAQFPERFVKPSANEMDRLSRFESIAVYMCLAMWLLRKDGNEQAHVAESAFDAMISDFDGSLREQGVGDMKIGPYIKKIASAFNGRLFSYGDALDKNDMNLFIEALLRNQCCDNRTEAEKIAENVYYEAYQLALDKAVKRWLHEIAA